MTGEIAHQIGIFGCMAYVGGCIVGSGIFITPKYVLEYTKDVTASLIVWIVAGLISLIGSIAYIELATAIPSDGGDYAYHNFVGWKAIAFCFMLITSFFTYPGSTSVQAVTFGEYLVQGINPYVDIDDSWKKPIEHCIAVALLVFCSLLNFLSLEKFASRFQIIVTAAKMGVLCVIMLVGAFVFFTGPNTAIKEPVEPLPFSVGNYVMALYSGLWSFAGWDILNYGIPSVKNPRRTLPITLITTLSLVTLLYVLVNSAFFVVLGPQKILESDAIAADFAQNSLGIFAVAVPFATAIMLLGTVNAEIFVSSRIIFEAARQGHLPQFLSAVHKGTNSYRAALLLQMAVSVAMTFVNVETVINYVSFVMWAQKLITIIALFYIKWSRMKVDQNVLKVPLPIPILFFACLVFLIFIPLVTQFMVTIIGVGIVASGLILYFIFIYPSKLPPFLDSINNVLSVVACRLLGSEIQKVAPQETKREPIELVSNDRDTEPSGSLLESK